MMVGDPVSVSRGKQRFRGIITAINTAPRKRKTGPGESDMVETVVSIEVEMTIQGLAGATKTTATVPPGAVRRI